jgi:hypothetical protein
MSKLKCGINTLAAQVHGIATSPVAALADADSKLKAAAHQALAAEGPCPPTCTGVTLLEIKDLQKPVFKEIQGPTVLFVCTISFQVVAECFKLP